MDSPSLGLRLGAEVLGTFLFFFLGFNAIAVSVDIGAGAIDSLGIAFAFGLGLALAIAALGHISGGHFNPAVSLGLAAARKFPPKEVIPYWIAQLVGGFAAVLAVALVYSGGAVDALDTAPGVGISNGGALLLELIATALFVIVICTVATDDRAPWKGVMAPLLIGLFIFTAAVGIGPASGGSFNPARSIAPAIWNGNLDDLWIYLVGPLVGGVIGGAMWLVFGPARGQEPETIRATGGLPQTDAAASAPTSETPGTPNR
jgi:aquaporin NIP